MSQRLAMLILLRYLLQVAGQVYTANSAAASSCTRQTDMNDQVDMSLLQLKKATPICTDSSLDHLVNGVVDDLIQAFNDTWPSAASNLGLDPWEDVYEDKIKIPCKYFGDYWCGVQTAACKSSFVKINELDIKGLGDLAVVEPSGGYKVQVDTSDTSCSNSALPNSACAFNSDLRVTASVRPGGKLEAILKDTKFKVECDPWWGKPYTTTVKTYDKIKCSSSDATAKAWLDICSSLCRGGTTYIGITSADVSDLKVDSSKTSLKCDVSSSFLTDDLISFLANAFETELYKVMEPIMETALQNELDKLIGNGFPVNSC